MYKVFIFNVIFLVFVGAINAQVKDVFRYRPVYEVATTNADQYDLQFISYKSKVRLKDLIDENDYDNPLHTLNEYLSASTIEERNASILDNSENARETAAKVKRSALLYNTDSVEVFVASQLIVKLDDEVYSYIKYALHFKYESLLENSKRREFPALKMAVKKDDKWFLVDKAPLGGRFKIAFYNCSTGNILKLLRGENLVDGYSVVSEDGVLDIERLIKGMDNNAIPDNTPRVHQDTISLSYTKEDIKLEQVEGQFWISQKGSSPVDPSLSIEAYDQEQVKLFLAVHRAIIGYTSNPGDSSISIERNELNLGQDMISKTHIIKYGFWDKNENTYVFRVERNGPYEIKRFSVYVTIRNDEYVLDFNSGKYPFEYVNFISGRLHATLFSSKFSREEKNGNLARLKSSCMNRVGNNTIVDFECFSDFIDQLSKAEREELRNINK